MTSNIIFFLSLFILIFAVSFPVKAIDKMVINGLFQDKAIVAIDGKQRVLKKGKASPEGVLLIEANSKEAIIEIDGKQNTYTLDDQIGGSFKKSTGGKKVSITSGPGGGYSISGAINGSFTTFLIDTGASFVSMNKNVAKRAGIDYKLIGKESRSYTASGTSKVYLVNLKRVRIGDIELDNIKGSVHDSDHPVITLLGMSFLERLNMKREGRLLELEKKY